MKRFILALIIGASFSASAGVDKFGPWIAKSETNKMTDQTDFAAINTSTDTYSKAGSTRETSLVLRCTDNKTEAYLSFSDYMGSDDPGITMRLDDGKPVKRTWGGGEGGDAAFVPQPIGFIKELAKYKKVIFGFEPYGTTMQIVEFDLSEIDKVIENLSQACKWK
ncbi:hypothetical protein BRR58_17625 [Salmonella enterica]|nr:hypothetical protein [Salmonella enterica]